MGRYRELVRALVYYSNSSNRELYTKKSLAPIDGISLSKHEYQILEYICEFEHENKIMVDISRDLGILQSVVTKATKSLSDYGLIDRYRINGNRKSIVLKPTQAGKKLYTDIYTQEIEARFTAFFNTLENFDDSQLQAFEQAIYALGTNWGKRPIEILEKIDYSSAQVVKE